MNFLSTIFAQAKESGLTFQLGRPDEIATRDFTIPDLIQFGITAILVVAGLVFFFMLILGGLKWVLSGGDKAQTEAARSQITAALIGIVIIFSAWAIVNLLDSLFGISILDLNLPGVGTGS